MLQRSNRYHERTTIIGTIAGDNTILIIADDPSNVSSLVNRFNEMIK